MEKQLVSLLTPHHGMMQLLRDLMELLRDLTQLLRDLMKLLRNLIQLLRDLIQLLRDLTQLSCKYQLANWLHSSLLVDCSFADYNQVDRLSVLLASCCFADYNQVDWITVLLIDFYSFLEHIGQHSNQRICELIKNQKTRICNNIINMKMR